MVFIRCQRQLDSLAYFHRLLTACYTAEVASFVKTWDGTRRWCVIVSFLPTLVGGIDILRGTWMQGVVADLAYAVS